MELQVDYSLFSAPLNVVPGLLSAKEGNFETLELKKVSSIVCVMKKVSTSFVCVMQQEV